MPGRIDPNAVRNSFKYAEYKRILDEGLRELQRKDLGNPVRDAFNISTIESDAFDALSAEKRRAPIFMIQTQGFMPKVPFSSVGTGSPWDRGWVASGTDTGGQTFYTLDEAMAMAQLGYHVIIVGQRFDDGPAYLPWFYDGSGTVEILRVPAGGLIQDAEGKVVQQYPFVRKEDLYGGLRGMVEDVVALALLRGAYGFIGGYADGGTIGVAAAHALGRPSIFVAHSMGLVKLLLEGMDIRDPASYYTQKLRFGARLHAERAAFLGADVVIANTPMEQDAYRDLYGISVPRQLMMPPGVNHAYFPSNLNQGFALEKAIAQRLMDQHDLQPGKYFMSWGRMASAKNLAGQAFILGELRKRYPQEYKNVQLVIVGGNPENPASAEEREEIDKVRAAAALYNMKIGKGDIVRIGNLEAPIIAFMAQQAIAYLGTQHHEPFGMAPAEMLALGGSGFVVVPEVSGIAQWAKQKGYGHAMAIIDLSHQQGSQQVGRDKYVDAAELIHQFRMSPDLKQRIADGRTLANNELRWRSLAQKKVDQLDNAAQSIANRPRLYLAAPFWRGNIWALPPKADEKSCQQEGCPGNQAASPQKLAPQQMVEISKQLGGKIVAWLEGLNAPARQLVTVAGEQAAILADLLAAAIDRPTMRVQRVSSATFDGAPAADALDAVKATPQTPPRNPRFTGVVEAGAKVVVTATTESSGFVGDISILINDGTNQQSTADVFINSAGFMAGPNSTSPFAATLR